LLALAGRSWAGPGDARQHAIDSLLHKALSDMRTKHYGQVESVERYADVALEKSRAIGYTHGIALALACQAFAANMGRNDFPEAEQLSRESLAWFDQTDDKLGVTVAHYVLGFALFAQSHFEEANRHYDLAREYARKQGNRTEELFMMSLMGEAYRESGDYEKAFRILRTCAEMAEAEHMSVMAQSQYLTLAGMFVQIEDFPDALRYFQLGYGNKRPEVIDPWDLSVYALLLTHLHKYDSALYYFGKFDSARLPPTLLRTYLASKGEYYLFREEYATALPYFQKSLSYQRQMNDNTRSCAVCRISREPIMG